MEITFVYAVIMSPIGTTNAYVWLGAIPATTSANAIIIRNKEIMTWVAMITLWQPIYIGEMILSSRGCCSVE